MEQTPAFEDQPLASLFSLVTSQPLASKPSQHVRQIFPRRPCGACSHLPDNWDENSSDIVGGVAAAQGDLPFIVSVQLSGSHFCGGSLVNANTVVSAAHCYEGRTGSSWTIRAGSLVCDHLFLDP
jgi:hypothetical protein